ncbi:PLD nuclease N-terminal domain-containing protein [Arthrobacter sp. ov118]|uniref:PLD nuclease N-terminal domain-containing protein n=1 Tax=Arthrobacter sp. ov118 TaxID=1761747 RepID=UPI0008F18918|nr:PLD nuclease N-terminal domain-containing protein [Arthrobacter sp. ov118]SFU05090.1 Phospholipase_D-nuclease N-terminal [Arthrobacter sp. ov118]
MNPIVPTAWEGMVIVAGIICAAMFIGALIGIARSRNHTPAGRALWLLIVLALPVFGPMLWFLTVRTSFKFNNDVHSVEHRH